MGLKEVAEDLKKQIEESEKEETEAVVVETEKPAATEKKEPEKAAEEAKAEKTNSDFARERRDRLSEQQRLRADLEAANARIAELSKANEPDKAIDSEPDKNEDPLGWSDWRARQSDKKAEAAEEMARKANERVEYREKQERAKEIIHQANNEMVAFEDKIKTIAPDYDDVKKFYVNMLAFSVKNLNPNISNEALASEVNNRILIRANQYLNAGHENPVKAIYDEAKAMGYKPSAKEEKQEEVKKPDLERVAKNRERNAGMAAASGSGGSGEITKRYAATEMTSQEWARLPANKREEIMRQG